MHRYHGHAIRKNIAQKVGTRAIIQTRAALARGERLSPWDLAYDLADDEFERDGGLIPHWVFTEGGDRIERHSPVLPMSRDADRVDALRRSLAVYRIVFGQPRQDDLMEFTLREVPDERTDSLATALTVNLSPLFEPREGAQRFRGRSVADDLCGVSASYGSVLRRQERAVDRGFDEQPAKVVGVDHHTLSFCPSRPASSPAGFEGAN